MSMNANIGCHFIKLKLQTLILSLKILYKLNNLYNFFYKLLTDLFIHKKEYKCKQTFKIYI